MYSLKLNDKLLDSALHQMFPDSNFEDKFKKGEYQDNFFVRREYIIRLGLPHDIDTLMEIEGECWAASLQTARSEIELRLIDPACYTFALEYGGSVRGVIYTQRIQPEDIQRIRSNTVHQYRVKTGSCIQFMALNMMPAYQDKGWGSELLEFVLQYFSLHPEINNVYAVTRCRDFMKSNCSTLQDYMVQIHHNGMFDDPILKFHQYHGAKVLGLIDKYRPNDDENQGYGVLIQYDINHRPWLGKSSAAGSGRKQRQAGRLLLDFLQRKLNTAELDDRQSLKMLGLDSLDFAEALNFMHEQLGLDISIHDLNDTSLAELLQLCEGGDSDKPTESDIQPLKKRLRSLIRQYPEIVPLAVDGEGPCTFWIHPLSGDVGVYNRIASGAKGTFSMIAIKACGFLCVEKKPFTSVIEMAKYYSEIITAVQPEGPYHLAGFSFGGTVAYEIARQLQMQGRTVDTLILVESPFISGEDAELFRTTYRNNLLMNANFLLLTLLNMDQSLLRKRPDGETDWRYYQVTNDDVKDIQDEALMKYVVRFCKQKGLKQTEEDLEFKLRSMSVVHMANLRAIQQYQAEKLPHPHDLSAWLFRTESAQAVSRTTWNPDYLENIQREKGSLLPLLQDWHSILPNLQTMILEGDNHFDILHSDESTNIFYEHCSRIFTKCVHQSESFGKSNAPDKHNKRSLYPPIAIVGISGRFPDAENVEQFWDNLKNGRNSVREAPSDRGWNIDDYYDPNPKTPGKTYSKWGGFLTDIDKFDPLFFKISPREAELMDPSERIFIQEAWKAIEDAGYNPGDLSGKSWGVFACAKGDFSITIQNQIENYYLPTDSYSASRLSYLLNLVGPSMTIDTACSSTLSVVVEACDSLVLGNCEAAIVGGGSVYTTPNILIGSSQSLLFSPDGLCYTFDQRANGTVVAEAVGAVVLKLLDKAIEDNDHIYGVIRGWGMNQDGKTNGITAPSGLAQSRLQSGVYEKFDINPENITMFEAHGTGTQLGDAIEFEALTESFRKFTTKTGYCAIGSLKTNIGHAFFGSGIAALIKVLLSVKHAQIPPSLHYEHAGPQMAVENSPFFVNTTLRKWETAPNQPRCAAINSFGATGTNAHLVVEEYIPNDPGYKNNQVRQPALIVLSAKDEDRLEAYVDQFVKALDKGTYTDHDLAGIAYTLQVGRQSMEARLAMTVTSIQELKEKLNRYLENKGDFQGILYNLVKTKKNVLEGAAANQDVQDALARWQQGKDSGKLLTLWVKGAVIDWESLYRTGKPKRVSLPTYPFAKQRIWIQKAPEVNKEGNGMPAAKRSDSPLPPYPQALNNRNPQEPYELLMFTEDWAEEPLANELLSELKTTICFLSNLEHQQMVKLHIQEQYPGANVIFISQGNDYRKNDAGHYSISTNNKADYEQAFRSIRNDHEEIHAILYLWPYEDPTCIEEYRNIVYILQAIAAVKVQTERLLLGAPYKSELDRCYLESWIGFERSIGAMASKTKVKAVIQIQGNFDGKKLTKEHVERILKETAVISKTQSVLYQYGIRYEYKIQETNPSFVTEPTPLKTGGTYLITGGLGKLGLIFARHLAQKYNANIILSGRSELNHEKRMRVKEIEDLGGRIRYIQADTSDRDGMRVGIEAAKQQFGDIHGVIHAAGTVDHHGIFQKDINRFEDVLNPKIKGTLLLDELLQGNSLDFICYFSSSAAILGDFGSCDYAIGNRFQMAYARYKNKLEEQKEALGKTIVINWPLWRDGGMGLEQDNNERYLKASGQRYLETDEGISIFENMLTQSRTQHLVMAGERAAIRRFLTMNQEQGRPSKTVQAYTGQSGASSGKSNEPKIPAQEISVEPHIEQDVKEIISHLHHLPVEKLDVDEHLMEYGFDSINLFEFAGRIAKFYGIEVTPSSLLGYSTIGQIIEYLAQDHQQTMQQFYRDKISAGPIPPEPERVKEEIGKGKSALEETIIDPHSDPTFEPIAIIGMSGRFPQADTVQQLWNNLKERKESITEVPPERWNWRDYKGDAAHKAGKSYSKWGGFLTDIDRFDPLFFKISPKEAHMMDPCQRLFLEEAWHALEDAGYMGERIKGKSCGVYVGIEEGEYGFMARQEGQFYSNQNAVLSARIAYALDLKGPNLSITASCSSGLVALHQACQALRHHDCEMALVGGVNLFVSPASHIGMSMLEMLSPTGKSYVFEDRADGMVPSEAVAVVLLKPLSLAIRDKDHIYGCIKGSGVNYNGKGHGIMSPNPLRHAELIQDTFDKYRIDPSNIQYILSHSVGTKLGDAAEIDGLRRAFGKYPNGNPNDKQQRYIGSVKPLIGHTFAASGIVSLITMLTAMREQTMLGLHNLETSNKNIDFTKTPFIASASDQPWIRQHHQPRLGAISTSANSGTNAFAVVEEYWDPAEELHQPEEQTQIIVLSATDQERLRVAARQLLEYIEDHHALSLSDIAYTLQVGREAMACRLAIVARSRDELVLGLNDYLLAGSSNQGIVSSIPIFTGDVEAVSHTSAISSKKYEEALLQQFIADNNFDMIAVHWTTGGRVNWEALHQTEKGRIIPLPTYPFKKERYWIQTEKAELKNAEKGPGASAASSSQANLEEYVLTFFSEKLDMPKEKISPGSHLQDYGVDSILMLKFIRDVEQNYQLRISGRDIIQYPTVRSLSAYLTGKLAADDPCEVPEAENRIERSGQALSEYMDDEVIEAMEKFIEGAIKLEDLEQRLGVHGYGS